MRVAVYHLSQMVAVVEAEPRVAWRAAVAYVRRLAHAHGQGGALGLLAVPGWGATANRPFYQRGVYRALPVHSDPTGRRPRVRF